MKFSEKVLIPLIVISLITAVACYYILEEYNKKQFEIKKGITSVAQPDSDDGNIVVSEADLKYEGTAILIDKNEEDKVLTFSTVDANKTLELYYSGATNFLGKHGKNMILSQFPIGEIVDVTYSIHSSMIDTMQMSQKSWSYTDVTRFSINERARMMEIGDKKFRLDGSVVVSYGEELAQLFDVTSVDTLKVSGVGKKVCSIIVEKGHGYIRLDNDTYFVGGWLEVGQEIIKPVSEGMLLPVPEGDYHIRVTNRGYVGEDNIEILRDKETIVDLSKVEITEVAIGHVHFEIQPDFAQLYVDGQMTEFDDRVTLEYGIHSVRVEYPGYETVNTRIRVDSEFADVSISLDKDADSKSSESSSNGSNSSSTTMATNADSSSSTSSFKIWTNTSSSSTIWPTINSTTATITKTEYVPVVGPASSSSTSPAGSASSSSSPSSGISSSSTEPSTGTSSSSTSPDTDDSETGTSSSSSTAPEDNDETGSSSSAVSYEEIELPDPDSSSDSSSSSSEGNVISQNRKLYVESPVGAEVYLDGNYIGIAPAACNKPVGTHIIVIYKNGYMPKSYTVDIADDKNDVTFSFSELYKE